MSCSRPVPPRVALLLPRFLALAVLPLAACGSGSTGSPDGGVPVVAVAISPTQVALVGGGTQQFVAAVTGTTDTAVTWTASAGSITSGGLYTAPAAAGTHQVIATSHADPTRSATAQAVVGAIGVAVAPAGGAVLAGRTLQFNATVTGSGNTAVTWSATGGTIDATGLYTAGSAAGTFQVTASSQADPSRRASVSVVVGVVAVSISPPAPSVAVNGTQQFTATVTGWPVTSVTWSATCGTVSASGLYTAPGAAGTCQVTATSQADPTKTATAAVTVTAAPAVAITISPTSDSVVTGGTRQFTATVTGSANTSVTWSATCGTVSASGLYTAPGAAGTCQVTATSQADPTKSATATVTVSAPGTGATTRTTVSPVPWNTFDAVTSSDTSVIQDRKPGAAGDLLALVRLGGWALYASKDEGRTWGIVTGPAGATGVSHTGGVAQDSISYDLHAPMNGGGNGNLYYSRLRLTRDASGHVDGWTWGASQVLVGPAPSGGDWTDLRFQIIEAVDGQGAKVLVLAYLTYDSGTGHTLRVKKTTVAAGVAPSATADFVALDGSAGETVVDTASGDANWAIHNQLIGLAQQPLDRSLHLFRGNAAEFFSSGPGIQRWRYAAGAGGAFTFDARATVAAQPAGRQGPCWGGLFQTQDSIWLIYYDDAGGGIQVDRITSDGTSSTYVRKAIPGPTLPGASWTHGYLGYASIGVNPAQTEAWATWVGPGGLYAETWNGHWNGSSWDAPVRVSTTDMTGFATTSYWRGGLVTVVRSMTGTGGELHVVRTAQP